MARLIFDFRFAIGSTTVNRGRGFTDHQFLCALTGDERQRTKDERRRTEDGGLAIFNLRLVIVHNRQSKLPSPSVIVSRVRARFFIGDCFANCARNDRLYSQSPSNCSGIPQRTQGAQRKNNWSLANAEKGGGEPTETRFLSLLRNVAGA